MAERALILDTGAVLAIIRRDRRVRSFLTAAQRQGTPVVVPPVVIAQVVRGGPQDAEANRLFKAAYLTFVGPRLARSAGELLAASGLTDAADALVVAEAKRLAPATILTSDPDDLRLLASGIQRVRIIGV